MRIHPARVIETRLLFGQQAFVIACPKSAAPSPGQFTLAADEDSILGMPLFNAGEWKEGFIAVSSHPGKWEPGAKLLLYGPQGRSFTLPGTGTHLALVSMGGSICFLWPLVTGWLAAGRLATLFSDTSFPELPTDLEVYPLNDLFQALDWADFIAGIIPAERLRDFSELMSAFQGGLLRCPGQVLVLTGMPCAGLGECGVCSVVIQRLSRAGRTSPGGHTWKLACKDGPVFNLSELLPETG